MSKSRVLIVDDDPLLLKLVQTTLVRGGYDVICAKDGQEGFEAARGEHPDLIVTDIMMPIVDGFELARRIRSDHMLTNTPLIMLTAKGEEEDRIKGLELGADDYMTKPFSPRELLARVGVQVRRRSRAMAQTTPVAGGPFSGEGFEHLAKFRFDDFVVGAGNQEAYEAAMTAAHNPGVRFNPLFIFGGPGIGKTHLICALANEAFAVSYRTQALYLTSEAFSQQVLDAFQNREIRELTGQYLSANIFMIDDIQFLAISQSLQSVASDILSQLYDAGKQIVISSDRSPGELATISAGISAELAFGRIVQIIPPGAALRAEILKVKARRRNWPLDDSLIEYLASVLATDIRSLEGVAARLVAMKTLGGITPDRDAVDRMVREISDIDTEGPAPDSSRAEREEQEAKTTAADFSLSDARFSKAGVGDISTRMVEADATRPMGPETPQSQEGRLPDPLVMEFSTSVLLRRILGQPDEIASTIPKGDARPIVVLGASSALIMDTVEALVGKREHAPKLPEGETWAYMVHVQAEDPQWVIIGAGAWNSGDDLARAIGEQYVPVFLVVLDSMSPKIIEARKLISSVPEDAVMMVVILVSSAEDQLEDARRTLSKSLKRLFRVPDGVPLAINGGITTRDARSWIKQALE